MLFYYLIACTLCLSGVQGLPVQEENSLSARALPTIFYEHAAAAIRKHAIGTTRTMMHSGIGPQKAFRVAKEKGLQTVETTMFIAISKDKEQYRDTLAKYCVPKNQFCERESSSTEEWVQAWGLISKAWAEYAEQQTTLATHKGGPEATSFYKVIEEPILQQKGIRINIENDFPAGSS